MKKLEYRFKNTPLSLICLIVMLLFMEACNDDHFSFQEQKRQVLMMEELKKDTSLSTFVDALERTNVSALLNTYGPYTVFAPDNNAFKKYFVNNGKKSLDDFSLQELKTLVVYHILPARVKSTQFIPGPQATPSGDNDFISLDISNGYKSNTIANGKALLYETDLEYSNGYLHKMDGVLDPPTITIGQFLLQNKDKFSIFTAGLQRAGLLDTLVNLENSAKQRIRLTVFAETNEVLQAAGINSYDDMPIKDLVREMKYHIIAGSEFSKAFTPLTSAIPHLGWPERWDDIRTTLSNDWIYFDLAAKNLINSSIDFSASDILMRNGVINTVNKHMAFDTNIKRVPIFHLFKTATSYGYGLPGASFGALPAAGGNSSWRISTDVEDVPLASEKSVTRKDISILFASFDTPNMDSVVTVVKGVKAGKYSIRVNFKNGSRATVQMKVGEDLIGVPLVAATNTNQQPVYGNKIFGSYTFRTSGDKRIKFVGTTNGGVCFESMILTPEYN